VTPTPGAARAAQPTRSPAAGDPAVFAWQTQQHVFYRDDQGNIQHVFYDSSVNHRFPPEQWASGTGSHSTGPAAAGNPATLVAANQQHIFYRDVAGNIWHVYWDQRSNSRTAEPWAGPSSPTGTPTAQGDPAVMEADSQQHLFYLGTDNNIWCMSSTTRTPTRYITSSGPAPAASPVRGRYIFFGKVSPELNGRVRVAGTNGTVNVAESDPTSVAGPPR
jgi:hypothetical protein